MKFLLITVGSRGDAEPFCSLAERLHDASHDVHLYLQEEHAAPSSVQIHSLPFSTNDFYNYVANPTHGGDHPNPRVRFVGVIADIIGDLVLPCYESVLATAKDSAIDMIVTSSLARPLAFVVGATLNLSVAVIHLQPLCPTKAFPHYSAPDNACVEAICNAELSNKEEYEDTYWELERFQHDFLQEKLTIVREKFGLEPQDFNEVKAKLSGDDATTIILNASPTIVPFVHSGKPNIYDVGPLGDGYISKDWQGAPQDLITFLEENPEPICIGFGSMPVLQHDAVKEAIAQIDRPVVVVGKAFVDETELTAINRVFAIPSIPYAWILPQCSMMVCHGGAGVVAATLRAGIPCLVAPLMGDQFFMASLLERLGLGLEVTPSLSSMQCQHIIDAVARVTDSTVLNAKRFGSDIQSRPSGVQAAIDAMEGSEAGSR